MGEIVKVLFQRASIEKILAFEEDSHIHYDNIEISYLQDLILTYGKKISDTEVNLQIMEVNTQIEYERQRKNRLLDTNRLDVFSVLFYYIEEILTFYENRCVCKYSHLLEWNELTKILGQDLPVTAFMASFDAQNGQECKNFSWPVIIEHNNGQLNKILKKGMSDNHFHLRCSSPYFEISWINLMNYPARNEYMMSLNEIEKNYRDKNKKSETGVKRESLSRLTLAAALIRLYLCSKMESFKISLYEFHEKETAEAEDLNSVKVLLRDRFVMENKKFRLQSEIDCLKIRYCVDDYLQLYASNQCYEGEREYQILAGERWFLYQMFKHIYLQDKIFCRDEYDLFYAYLRIKNELRSELIQVNALVGFENFQIYQSRKDFFSHTSNWVRSEEKLARLAVRTVLNNPAMKYLEVRISPEDSAEKNAYWIQTYDKAIISNQNLDGGFEEIVKGFFGESEYTDTINSFSENDLRRKFHYIFQFPKSVLQLGVQD